MKSLKTLILKGRGGFTLTPMRRCDLSQQGGFTSHLFPFSKKPGRWFTPHLFPFSGKGEGFTILEVSIVIGLFAMLIALGLLLSMDVWRGSSFQSEQDVVTSLLYKARSRAISNVNESSHGLFINTGEEKYFVFEGGDYDSATDKQDFPMGNGLTFTGDTEIVFTARTGTTTGPSFTMNGQGKSREFTINEEGGITW